MKKLHSLSLLTLMALLAASCKQDMQSATGPKLPLDAGGSSTSTPAHPAITYKSSVTTGSGRNRHTYPTIGVMDTDGTHQTNIYTSTGLIGNPTWSPTGGSIAWQESPSAGVWAIKAIDVSVNSSGVAVGSNLRTIHSWQTSDSVALITYTVWCQQSTTGKIAFNLYNRHTETYLCTVPESGGSVTILDSGNTDGTNQLLNAPTWSPNDSNIATCDLVGTANSIVVLNASTGAVTDSIPISISRGQYNGIRWSHSGLNKLAISGTPVYYLTPTSGSTPTTNSVNGYNTTWSPNNSGIMSANGNLTKIVPFTTTTTTILSSFSGTQLDWRQN